MLPFARDGIHFTSPGDGAWRVLRQGVLGRSSSSSRRGRPVRPKTSRAIGKVNHHHVLRAGAAARARHTQVTNPATTASSTHDGSGAPPAITSVQVIAPRHPCRSRSPRPRAARTSAFDTPTRARATSRRPDFACAQPPATPTRPLLYGNALQNWGITFDIALPDRPVAEDLVHGMGERLAGPETVRVLSEEESSASACHVAVRSAQCA